MAAAQEDDPVGTLRLEGQVIDEHEAPVPGARVAIDTRPPRVVETEGDGSFHFEGLIGRHYRLEASAGGGYAGPVQLRLQPDTEPVILRMRAATTVGIRVRGPDGPVAGARVELRSTLTWPGETGDDGLALLEGVGAGWHVLRVEAEGFAPHAEGFPIRGASSRQDHTVTLAHGVRVEGLVADETGEPIAGARVLAVNVSEPYPVTDLRRDAVTTNDEGNFALPALAPGTYRFVAAHPDHAQGTTAPTHIDGQQTRFVRIALSSAGVIEGVVSNARGEAVAAAQVRAVAAGGIWWRYAREAFTAEDGSFRITGLPRRALDVVASHESGSSPLVRANLAERATARVALTLELTGVVAGLVVDGHGEPVPEAQVTAEPQWTGEKEESQAWDVRGGSPMAITDFRGRFRFVGLPSGSYRVHAARPGAPLPALWSARGVPARTGDEDVRVVLPPESLVRGRVLFADGSAPTLYAVTVGGLRPAPFSADDGSFEVRAPGGERDLEVSGPQFERKVVADVEIDGETDVGTITVERGRSVSGLVLAPDGSPVADARVAGGRLIAGGGSELNIPGEGFLVKETRTDAEGRYLLTGFGAHAVTLVAQAEGVGRSLSVTIPRGPASAEVDLRLEPVGSLEGRITVDGEPQAETVVLLNPLGANSSNFFVLTGPDGRFAFDVLAPGEYVGYPILGRGGNKAKDMFVQRVTVRSGERARLDVDATYGGTALEVTLRTVSGEPVPVASAVSSGSLTSRSTRWRASATSRFCSSGRWTGWSGSPPGRASTGAR